MRRVGRIIGVLAFLLWFGEVATAQIIIDRRATTPIGDILQGQGQFLSGAGLYNYYSAQAYSIETDTSIRLNEYMFQSFQSMNRESALRREAMFERRKEAYDRQKDRVRNRGDYKDLNRGSLLNAMLTELLDPKRISPSSFRDPATRVPFSTDLVRLIPFTLAEAGTTFSMKRLLSFNKWPTALRDPQYAAYRRDVERTFDAAMEQLTVGKVSTEAILAVEAAINQLEQGFDLENAPRVDRLYNDAKAKIRTLRQAKDLLKDKNLQQIVAELDKYSGTTVGDLVEFMRRNHLQFGVAEIGDETELYARIYALMSQQFNVSTDATGK